MENETFKSPRKSPGGRRVHVFSTRKAPLSGGLSTISEPLGMY